MAFWTTFGEYFGPPSGGIWDHPLERGRAQDDQKKGDFLPENLKKYVFLAPKLGPFLEQKSEESKRVPYFNSQEGGLVGLANGWAFPALPH